MCIMFFPQQNTKRLATITTTLTTFQSLLPLLPLRHNCVPAVCLTPFYFMWNLIAFSLFVHSFHKYLLNNYYILGNSHKIQYLARKLAASYLSAVTIRKCCKLGRKTSDLNYAHYISQWLNFVLRDWQCSEGAERQFFEMEMSSYCISKLL